MMKIGLTGGIGSGKSIVASLFATMGIPIYIADVEAKRIMVEDRQVRASIVELLGASAFQADGGLDRAWVASRVFADDTLLYGLNAIVHPAVHHDFRRWADRQQAAYVIEEAAILFESGGYRHMDRVICIHAPEDVRIARVMARDEITADQVRARMAHQLSPALKLSLSDHVIHNDGTQALIPQVVRLHRLFVGGE